MVGGAFVNSAFNIPDKCRKYEYFLDEIFCIKLQPEYIIMKLCPGLINVCSFI